MTDTDPRMGASYVRLSRELSLTIRSAHGYGLYQPPVFAMVPLKEDSPQTQIGVAWKQAALGTDDQLELLIDSLVKSLGDKPLAVF